jgi:hypothetical protein
MHCSSTIFCGKVGGERWTKMAGDRKAALFRLVGANTRVIVPFSEAREGIPLFCVHSIEGTPPHSTSWRITVAERGGARTGAADQ